MTQRTELKFAATDGTELFARSWTPATPKPKGTLFIVHGLKDHGERYAPLAEQLAAAGWAVHAADLRGHGKSGGPRVYVPRFDVLVDDLEVFVDRIGAKAPFLFGHSMGGTVVTTAALRGVIKPAGIVLSGPAIRVTTDISKPAVISAKVFGALIPKLPIFSLKNADFCRDAKVVEDMTQDPLVSQKAGPARTLAQLLGGMERICADMEKLGVPFLAMHGTADKLTNPDGSRELHQRASSKDKTLQIYDGFFHDLLHEPEKERVIGDLKTWLEARAG